MKKSTIASRAGEGFYKSYIRNIQIADRRAIKGHKWKYNEEDYFFTYKRERYRVNQYICPDKKGEVIYSAKFQYEVIKIGEKGENNVQNNRHA
ncbi:MAG: hypothetical protein HFG37_08590 [Eubacterium sp.]|nr:hypothetical protein [Eubacterium sp.]